MNGICAVAILLLLILEIVSDLSMISFWLGLRIIFFDDKDGKVTSILPLIRLVSIVFSPGYDFTLNTVPNTLIFILPV